eukprot:1084293-Prymnesium_polylepis.1
MVVPPNAHRPQVGRARARPHARVAARPCLRASSIDSAPVLAARPPPPSRVLTATRLGEHLLHHAQLRERAQDLLRRAVATRPRLARTALARTALAVPAAAVPTAAVPAAAIPAAAVPTAAVPTAAVPTAAVPAAA